MEANSSGKHSSLLQYGNNYVRKKFCGKGSILWIITVQFLCYWPWEFANWVVCRL